ncbi:MAG: hypothetical protein GF405_02060 [Candidatus Eisenbacteria bacterium]|nr:hypothetical protein [Candidatus Eisenbacteria bacterium]
MSVRETRVSTSRRSSRWSVSRRASRWSGSARPRETEETRLTLTRRCAATGLTVVLVLLAAGTTNAQLDDRFANDPRASTPDTGPAGRWRNARRTAEPELTDAQKEELERLRSIGYLSGTNPAPEATSVTVHDEGRAWNGLNFLTSGHFAGARLMDMDGRVIHEWEYPYLEAWPDSTHLTENEGTEYWRVAHLYPNGDVVAVFEGFGIIKVDRDSRLIWKRHEGEHHDLTVTDDGRVYVLTRKAHMVRRVSPVRPILEDFVTVLDASGREVRSVSVLEAIENSPFSNVMNSFHFRKGGDIFHTNALVLLDGTLADRIPAFEEGNVLVSLRQLSLLAAIDMETEAVEWIATGMWLEQHHPVLLPEGRILLFDNKGGGRNYATRSRIVEFDPVTQERTWLYQGATNNHFHSEMCGTVQPLPNGNTLITESDNGRAFEVTREGETVWEYLNPERSGPDDTLIATLFEVVRLPPDFPIDWAQGR